MLVADCYPVALSDGRRVAMLHCGWRPLAGGIVEQAVATFDSPPAAAVGPGIGGCCYEVGPRCRALRGRAWRGRGAHARPAAVIARGSRAAGVSAIEHLDRCTCCEPELFFSHRRDEGLTGRQGGMCVLSG